MVKVFSIAAALLAGVAPLAGAAQARTAEFTIKQVLSAPFPSSLTGAAAAGEVAWVSDNTGTRNVWVAASSDGYTGRQLTHFSGDDGTDMGQLTMDRAGRQLAFTRGGSLEGGGPVNIMSAPGGAPLQEVWVSSTTANDARRVGNGNFPTWSPDGKSLAYISGGQPWIVAPASSGPPSQLLHDRGSVSSLTWSPDGSKLAFISRRTDHSIVGVYDTAHKLVTWLAPSVDTDQAPVWSPDGARLAFVRQPAGANHVFAEHREDSPWSIWIADATTGQGHAVWTASRGPGSVFQSPSEEASLIWGAGDNLVFPWEKDGWLHLYSLPIKDGTPRLLTPGPFEVFNVAVSDDRKRIVYAGNLGDLDHRHLWEVAVSGGAPRQLTRGATIEDYPAVAGNGQVFTLHGDARRPMTPVMLDEAARMRDLDTAAIPPGFPMAKLVVPQPVVFKSPDGLDVHAQLFLPPPGKAARGPAMLFFHGGPTRQMLLGWHPMDAYAYFYGMNQYLASEGYVVLSVNYRGGMGYGLDFREPKNFAAGGASEYNDIRGAALYLRGRADVDPARIGVYGGSYGGLMTALGLSRASDLLAAGVDYAGVHDWRSMLRGLNITPEAAQLAYDSSAMATIGKWRSPVLVVHADDDRNVPFAQSVELVEGLRKHNVEVEQVILPDEIHDLLRFQSWLTFFGAADDFFGRKLMSPGSTVR